MSRLSASASVISIVLASLGVAGSAHRATTTSSPTAVQAAATSTTTSFISRVLEPKVKPRAVSAAPVNLPDSRGTTAHPAVVVEGGNLALQVGTKTTPWFLTGINAYDLTSLWGVNPGCGWGGWNPTSLDAFFASLPANAVVRTWFFQADATQVVDGVSERNWTALDQMLAQADKYNVHLVLTLGNQDGTCDDATWKGPDWYAGGYASVAADTQLPSGPGNTSYAQWVADAVSRYAGNPAVAMWEPMNEPQPATCSASPGWDCWSSTRACPSEATARQDLTSFFTTIGGEIHRLDPTKLVSDGSISGDGCGSDTSADFEHIIDSPGIDIVGYHDYSGMANPPDLEPRTSEATAMAKPTMVGEAGVTGCASATARAQIFAQKIADAKADGVDAYVAWWYDGDGGDPTCNSPIDSDSPAWATIMSSAAAG